jgi:release factor glutamine methyltransferase
MHIVENNGDKSGIRLHKFMDIELELGSDVLVPREETEILGRAALGLLYGRGADARVIDMCCGSGNLGLAIAAKMPGARVWSADLTDSTVATARRNADRLGLADRVTIAQGDLFGAFDGMDLAGSIDLVVCNPPYISSARLEGDRSELLASEPREAFDGGPYGLSIHQRLIRDAVTSSSPAAGSPSNSASARTARWQPCLPGRASMHRWNSCPTSPRHRARRSSASSIPRDREPDLHPS